MSPRDRKKLITPDGVRSEEKERILFQLERELADLREWKDALVQTGDEALQDMRTLRRELAEARKDTVRLDKVLSGCCYIEHATIGALRSRADIDAAVKLPQDAPETGDKFCGNCKYYSKPECDFSPNPDKKVLGCFMAREARKGGAS